MGESWISRNRTGAIMGGLIGLIPIIFFTTKNEIIQKIATIIVQINPIFQLLKVQCGTHPDCGWAGLPGILLGPVIFALVGAFINSLVNRR